MNKTSIYTILFGFFIPFSIYTKNIGEINLGELTLPFSIIVLISLLALTITKALKGKVQRVAILLSITWLFFFLYRDLRILGDTFGLRLRFLIPIMITFFSTIIFIAYRLKETSIRSISNGFFITSILIFIYPTTLLITGLAQEIQVAHSTKHPASKLDTTYVVAAETKFKNDIFYIILDGYGGNEVLSQYIGVDNAPFYKMLEDKGFIISYNSRSNYPNTQLSLASSLNMIYLDSLFKNYNNDYKNLSPVKESIYNSSTFKLLKQYGYNIVMITSSSHLNPKKDKGLIDEFFTFMHQGQYIIALWGKTPLNDIFSGNKFFYSLDADGKPWVPESIDWVFNKGKEFVNNGKKEFIFMHILCPHEPYYFNKNGEIQFKNKSKKWNNYEGAFDKYRLTYGENLLGLNKKTEIFLNSLLKKTLELPIVILQGDHGPPEIKQIVLDRAGINDALFRTSILNAFLLPPPYRKLIKDRMTPVNTFRIISNIITGKKHPIIANKSFKSSYSHPFLFERYKE